MFTAKDEKLPYISTWIPSASGIRLKLKGAGWVSGKPNLTKVVGV